MTFTQHEKTTISKIIADAIDDLLKFPFKKQPQTLTALQFNAKRRQPN